MVGKGNYRRLFKSGTRKARPKGWEVRGREPRPGQLLPVSSAKGPPEGVGSAGARTKTGAAVAGQQRRKGALSVARRTKGSGGHPGKRNGRRHGERNGSPTRTRPSVASKGTLAHASVDLSVEEWSCRRAPPRRLRCL
jgi:hypothetical protein